jgi:hypothetical protein
MKTSTTTAPVPPTLIVFGTPKGATEPRAAWFRAEYAQVPGQQRSVRVSQPWRSTPTTRVPLPKPSMRVS